MAVVYRYVDLHDEVIKYVGIVWSENRTLKQRVKEHFEQDDWCIGGYWRVEYLQKEVKSRIDAELLEAHYISKFKTNEWYNVSKANWGASELLQDDPDEEWKEYETIGDIKPSNMIKTCEEGYINARGTHLVFYDDEEKFVTAIVISPEYMFGLNENSNISVTAFDVFQACLSQIKIDELENEEKSFEIYKELINGKVYHFIGSVRAEISEITGAPIRSQIGQIIINSPDEGPLNILFDSVKDVLNSPTYYCLFKEDQQKYDNFQLSDLEKALGLTSTNQNESAERK